MKDSLIFTDLSKQENPRIGLVNDEPVYSNNYKMMIDYYYIKLTRIKNKNLTKNDSLIVRDSAWAILIKETILAQEIRIYHISVSDEELKINGGVNLQDTLLITGFFNDVLEPYENDVNISTRKKIEYGKLYNEMTKNISSESKKIKFIEWYNNLRSKAEIHDLRDRFFREK